ncbi:MAG: amino acid adenylation domain-containing protein [Pyrinomonadaceae bacterium]
MSEAKRNLLEKYLRGDLKGQPAPPRNIAPLPRGTRAQLSFAQERLWFLDQLNPDSAVFTVPLAVRLSGPIDPSVLERSINEIARRHDALRTTFATVDGQPVPIVRSELNVELSTIDLASDAEHERETRAHTLLSEEAARPFDLTKGPLIRTTLLRLDEHDHLFLVVMHHIVSDGWSLVLFFQELSAIYDAFARGEQSPLSALTIQYADYAAWQREWLKGEILQTQLAYWKGKLAGELPVLDIPTDRPRPAVQTFRGAREWLVLSEDLTASITALGQREGVTLFITLLAAFKILLCRYTGQEDVIVGSPIANRPQTETESIIGFFLNNLALRSDISGNPSFREVLARVRKTALEAYANQDVPFEKLIEALKPERSLSRTPIFQVYFNLFNFADEIKLPGSDKTVSFVDAWARSDEDLSKFDLTLYAGQQGRELKLALVYNTDLFDADTIKRMLTQFRALLEGVVAGPEKPISDLRTEATTDHNWSRSVESIRVRPTKTFTEFKQEEIEQTIAERFAKQAAMFPQRIAVKSRNHEWTYQDLDRAVDSVAQTLLRLRGAGEERIALLFEHDAPMIAGMLGSLKAGKTYVPLDPCHPIERLGQIVEHSESTSLLTNSKNLALATRLAHEGVQLINIDEVDTTASTVALPAIGPDKLAYILYTSGSTGQPKGVMQNHRNVLHYIRVYTNNLHLNAGDRLTLLSSYCFDASVMDIYGALLNGATLCPIDIKEEGLAGLSQRLIDEEITVYHSTPTVYRYFVQTLNGNPDFPNVRLIVLGGEEVKRTDVELYQKHFSDDCLFVNGLGPTEATVSLQNFIDKQTQMSGESVPVGFPVANTELLLLNDAGRSSEIFGEIAIKSAHVALGYWRNSEANAAAFSGTTVPPVNHAQDARVTDSVRIYRTGDMGRRLPDGSIKFEGRKDFQIKIRGFRVELAEIESALAQHQLVRESVVVAKENAAGDKRLIAYVVPREQASINGELREFLKQKLPEYMVPSSFVVLDSLPLTASGKLNRRALPAPDDFNDRPKLVSDRPTTPLQILLAGIWADLLDVKEVGVDENFFELGGHSLLAVRLFAEILKRCGKALPLATLFQAPTVAQLAGALEKDLKPEWSSLVAINPIESHSPFGRGLGRGLQCPAAPATPLFPGPSPSGRRETTVANAKVIACDTGSKPPFFCVHALGGNVLEYHDLARYLGKAQPFYGLQSGGLDGKHAPHTRVEDMAAHYIKEMRQLQPAGPYFIGGRSLGGMIAFEMARQLRAQGQEVGLLALLDTYPSGYAKLLRDQKTLRPCFERAVARTKAHISNLSGLSLRDKFLYLVAKSKFAPRKMKSHLWRQAYNSFANLGRPLPRALQDIKELNSLAVREYVPHVYDGHITLFWASSDLRASVDFVEGWRALAGGGIEVHEIPGSHLDIVKEPHVQELANKLSGCLERAQAIERAA